MSDVIARFLYAAVERQLAEAYKSPRWSRGRDERITGLCMANNQLVRVMQQLEDDHG